MKILHNNVDIKITQSHMRGGLKLQQKNNFNGNVKR